jgi:rSAM/selenodomain-associated transferase 2
MENPVASDDLAVSVVIPTLNEARTIGATLDALSRVRGITKVIVVDGGSSDDTPAVAAAHGACVLACERGRGRQLQCGASAAQGEILWFVHADTYAPPEAVERIRDALRDPRVAAGNFSLRFDGDTRPARVLTRLYPHFRKLGLLYGDSGIFVRRSVYEDSGGFQPYPIFEDLDLLRRVKRRGRFVSLPCTLLTSSRRFEGRSFAWTFARWTGLQVLYWLGVSPHRLGRMYAEIRGRHT